MSIFIKNALLNGKKQNILIEDNLISYIGKDKQEADETIKLWVFSEKIQADKKSGKALLMFGKRNVRSKSYKITARFLIADGVVVAKDYSDEDENIKSKEDESIFNTLVPFGFGLLF